MASLSCASTLPWTPASSPRPSADRRLTASRRAPSLVIVAQGKVKKYRQVGPGFPRVLMFEFCADFILAIS